MTSPPAVAVVDYGAGNLRSVSKALERSGLAPTVTSDAEVVAGSAGVVLPGVGAFAETIAALRERGLDQAILSAIESGARYLGLCLGLQILFDESDEHGVNRGLAWLSGRVERFPEKTEEGEPLCVPHIGWNEVRFQGDHPMVRRLAAADCFYFVHSYRAVPVDPGCIAGRTEYGGSFAAAVARDNVFAVQFHPEKSQTAGRRLLDAYRAWFEES